MLEFLQARFAHTKNPPAAADGLNHGDAKKGLAERRETARQARIFARRGVLVEHAARDTAEQFGLDARQSGGGLILVAGGDRRLDLLDEGPDAADAGAVDLRAGSFACGVFAISIAS
jgi:hypothetical protein